MAVALTVGMVLARRKRFRAHAWTQSTVLLLNLVAIGGVMWPSFRRQVMSGVPFHPVPRGPGAWNDPSHVVPLVHAALGSVTELLGLYVILVAGTRMLPRSLRFRNYKAWMRTTLALWWVVVGLGLGVYGLWYVQGSQAAPQGAAPAASGGGSAVTATNFDFAPKQITVPVGATVEWVVDKGRHQVVADDGSFRSAVLTSGGKFQQHFTKAGTYAYHCEFHGDVGGKDMAGTIVVK